MSREEPLDPKKRSLMKRVGLATAAGGIGFTRSITAGFSNATGDSSAPSISRISIETAEHPSKSLVAYTSNVHSGGYTGLYLSRNTSSPSESPNNPSVIAPPNEYGVWGIEWTDDDTIEYQYGMLTKSATIGDGNDLLNTQATQLRGQNELSKEDAINTQDGLPDEIEEAIKAIKDICIPDPRAFAEQFDTSLASPTSYSTNLYCTQRAPPAIENPGGGGSFDDEETDSGWTEDEPNCVVGSPGGDDTGSSDETTTTTTTTTTTSTTTTTTTATTTTTTSTTATTETSTVSDFCTYSHCISMWVPGARNLYEIIENPKQLLPVDFHECDGRERALITAPLLNKVVKEDCDGKPIEVNDASIWLGLDVKGMLNGNDCNLYVGVTEEFANGTVERTPCTKFCDEGRRFRRALFGQTKFIETMEEIAADLAYWVENNTDVKVDPIVIQTFIYLHLIVMAIIAVGAASKAGVISIGLGVILGLLSLLSSIGSYAA